jgi:pyruvate,water dikinase
MEILWLGHPDCHDVHSAGAKAANLSRLVTAYRIPPGFCIPAAAYTRWAEDAGSDHLASPTQPLPAALSHALVSAYRSLGTMCDVTDLSVAVRSSAVDEDGASRSFAGQYETSLNVIGVDAVAEAVVRCWASVCTERALAYRQGQGLSVAGGCSSLSRRIPPQWCLAPTR